jgi:hypothetical protein
VHVHPTCAISSGKMLTILGSEKTSTSRQALGHLVERFSLPSRGFLNKLDFISFALSKQIETTAQRCLIKTRGCSVVAETTGRAMKRLQKPEIVC